jgi:hypothetical protein
MTRAEQLILSRVAKMYADGMKYDRNDNYHIARSSADGKGYGFTVQEPIVKGDRTYKARLSNLVINKAIYYYTTNPTELVKLLG